MPARITPLADPAATPSSRRLAWLASGAEGVPLGSAFLRLFTREGQTHLAELEVTVHPAERRCGVGTALLDAAVHAARGEGRRAVIAQAQQGSPGGAFLAARGFREVLSLTYARLELADIDLDHVRRIAEQPGPGYYLTAWTGVVPDEIAQTYAASRRAMDDMPMGDTDYGTVVWDVERVVAAAEAIEKRGDVLHTVAAVEASSGSIVGFSELVLPGDGKGDGQHYGTAVLPEHRGHGLGLRMKAETILHAHSLYPDLALLTDTAAHNTPMLRVNDTLGYRPTHTAVEYQLDL
ncbi:GNAT family N-acetyltransferase [Streptomyces ipomoeae]|uniref:Acetyltransferase, GNAT family n=1 Tax=Streptomyces ipomoeae 91-03 TaxID=698759 RepID=L1L4D4_9ACTN|nr:GNAT family N-acetyltransferase [Streptomyces ipomoeae]EKX67463.1 acetyltransferase, GNAT family [Streptomyces ipomoeae 91-03]MDX2700903.1 GNAT family N-acetyltransferase [Streptomyces ipomoeae]MDX2828602.1 GNAT family N-acetyltransferase [Streptomyces ipomoeae]MDX2846540.1 GNAT family N-acetyltransferase [Streptomyces ipomoeae]MDX2873615.1 GNAT family N-acetyltransferase [Streptomyces ipomoeae]